MDTLLKTYRFNQFHILPRPRTFSIQPHPHLTQPLDTSLERIVVNETDGHRAKLLHRGGL